MNKAMSKSIVDYLPKKKVKRSITLVQAHLSTPLVMEVKKYMEIHEMTWVELLGASLMNFRDTVVRKK